MRSLLLGLAAGLSLVAAFAFAGDKETPENSRPKLLALTLHKDGDAACAEIEKKFMAKLRAEFADKDVLFLKVDVTSRGSRHQAKLLLNSLALEEVWRNHGRKSGRVLLVDPVLAEVNNTLSERDSVETARKMLATQLAAVAELEEDEDLEEMEEEEER